MHLGNRGVVRVAHVRLAVGEEVVDDHSDDGEEEDDETPEDLVRDGAVRLKDLDPDKNIEDQNDETDNSTTSSVVPRLSASDGNLVSDGSSKGKRSKPELEESDDSVVEHFGNHFCSIIW